MRTLYLLADKLAPVWQQVHAFLDAIGVCS